MSDTVSRFWQHGTFTGVLVPLSLIVMGLFWAATAPLLLLSALFLYNAGKSSEWVFPALPFSPLVSYLSQNLHNKSSYLLKTLVDLLFCLIIG